MLKHTRSRLLAAVTGGAGWAHPYTDPFTCYADGGDSGGGQGDDGAGDGDGDAGDDGDDSGDADDSDDGKDGEQDDAELGEKGVKALRELRRENRRLKAQLRGQGDGGRSGRKTSAKDGGKEGEDQDDAESIREKARAEARAEVWNERVEAAAIAAAAGRLANPTRVAALLREDLAEVPEDDKGRPDKSVISELIDELLESDPYLAAPATGGTGRRFQGDADGGARKKTQKAAASLDEAIAAKFAGKTGG
jgi:hypothetical protein